MNSCRKQDHSIIDMIQFFMFSTRTLGDLNSGEFKLRMHKKSLAGLSRYHKIGKIIKAFYIITSQYTHNKINSIRKPTCVLGKLNIIGNYRKSNQTIIKDLPAISLSKIHLKNGIDQFIQQLICQIKSTLKSMQTQITLRELRERPKPKKTSKEARQLKEQPKQRHGHWKRHEHAKYIEFIRKYYYIMRSSLLRYHYRIFTTMADQIGTRNAVQCKSHHQKMIRKAKLCIESLVFPESDLHAPIKVGEGLQGNHLQSLKIGVKNIETTEKLPYIVFQCGAKLLVILDDRFIQNY